MDLQFHLEKQTLKQNSPLRAECRDRIGSIPVWKTGAPPFMRILQLNQYVKQRSPVLKLSGKTQYFYQ